MKPFGLAAFAAVMFAGCSQSSSPDADISITDDSTQSPYGVLVASRSGTDVATDCPDGGVDIDTGVDLNGNGTLDSEEITETFSVCHGTEGNAAETLLVSILDLEAGSTCTNGGKQMVTGFDANANAILDASEITNSESFCNFYASVVEISDVPAGETCEFGGQQFQTGWDMDFDGAIDGTAVTTHTICTEFNEISESYVCNASITYDSIPMGLSYRIDEYSNGDIDVYGTVIANGAEINKYTHYSKTHADHQDGWESAQIVFYFDVISGSDAGRWLFELTRNDVNAAAINATNDVMNFSYSDSDGTGGGFTTADKTVFDCENPIL